MQYESGVKRRDLKQEILSMAGIQELVLTAYPMMRCVSTGSAKLLMLVLRREA